MAGATSAAMRKDVLLGRWTCPSGNSCDVYLTPPTEGAIRQVHFAWDVAPPLAAADEIYYLTIIRPAVMRRAQEYLEIPGGVAVVTIR
jgi:hypothetical protein